MESIFSRNESGDLALDYLYDELSPMSLSPFDTSNSTSSYGIHSFFSFIPQDAINTTSNQGAGSLDFLNSIYPVHQKASIPELLRISQRQLPQIIHRQSNIQAPHNIQIQQELQSHVQDPSLQEQVKKQVQDRLKTPRQEQMQNDLVDQIQQLRQKQHYQQAVSFSAQTTGFSTMCSVPSSYPISFTPISTFDDNMNFSYTSTPDSDKRRKRRESHNAVERRRRDTINEKISELSLLLPDLVQEIESGQKPQKGIILRRTVDYIQHAQDLMIRSNQRIHELEYIIRALLCETGRTEKELALSLPLGTVIANTDVLVPNQHQQSKLESPTELELDDILL